MTVASYTEKSAALVLQMIFGYKVVVSQDVAKSTMQDIQIKVWRQGLYFSSVTVNIYQYQQNGPNKKIAYSVLTDQTASTIDFNFAPDLWEKYDQKWIDPHLEG